VKEVLPLLLKNVSVVYKGTKINIIDTPGHADFGGEVERVLNMADGVCLLVDALKDLCHRHDLYYKKLDLGLKPCVVINKVDKENCTPEEVHEKVLT
jgi:GTP-binding protein